MVSHVSGNVYEKLNVEMGPDESKMFHPHQNLKGFQFSISFLDTLVRRGLCISQAVAAVAERMLVAIVNDVNRLQRSMLFWWSRERYDVVLDSKEVMELRWSVLHFPSVISVWFHYTVFRNKLVQVRRLLCMFPALVCTILASPAKASALAY